MNARLSLSFLRMSAITGVILCILLTGFSLLHYPAILYPLRIGITYLVILAIVLLSYIILALLMTRNSESVSVWLARRGLKWGLVIASFWLFEIITGNLLDPKYSLVKLFYFGSSILAFALPMFAGVEAARQTGLIRHGALVGLWGGIVSGILTFLCLMAVTYVFLNTLLHDPQNLLQFRESGAPDLATFVMGDSLAGATGHLVIGLILGPSFGAIGGLLGKAFAEPLPKSTG